MLPPPGKDCPEMLMTGRLQRPADDNRATRIVQGLWPIHSPAEKANAGKGNPGKDNPAETDKASRPKQETQRQTPLKLQGNNPDPRPAAHNLATVAARAPRETTRPAGAAAKEQPTNGAA